MPVPVCTTMVRARLGRSCAVILAAWLLAHPAAANATDFGEGRLWRISRTGVADSYVLGTIHIVDPRLASLPRPVEHALARSFRLMTELSPDTVTHEELAGMEELDNDARLEPLIGTDAYLRLRAELAARDVPEQSALRLRPWAAMLKLTGATPRDDARSLDEQILRAARALGLRITPLESMSEQAAAFDAIPLESQVALLRHALERRDTLAAASEPTIAAWLRGDLAALANVAGNLGVRYPGMHEHYRRLVRHIIHDRTAVMHHRLVMPLRAGRVFVAVGAAHLPGNGGLLALLARDGYRVSRVW